MGRSRQYSGFLLPIGSIILLIHCQAFAQEKDTASGQSQFIEQKRVEYLVGSLPVIISVPHGGKLTPESIPDRTRGTLVTDRNTEALAREIAQAFIDLTGKSPHIIFCHLKRTKLDCNRPLEEAAQGNKEAGRVWQGFHGYIQDARETIVRSNGSGLYLDLHGQSHPAGRLELGYLISNVRLQRDDADIDAMRRISSIRSLRTRTGASFSEILRGKTSFGGLMQDRGYPSIPSPAHPHAGEGRYFSGGPNTRRHCLPKDGRIFGFQVECPFKNVRDSEIHRKKFAKAFAESVMDYLRIHTGTEFAVVKDGSIR